MGFVNLKNEENTLVASKIMPAKLLNKHKVQKEP